ncbi:MAG: alpha/beta fold hydrolase [Anaplasma ovis]
MYHNVGTLQWFRTNGVLAVVAVLEDRVLIPSKEDHYMYYKVYNPEVLGEKTPLICVHGMAGNSACFDYLGRAVPDFPVVSVDVVGRGRSSWLKDYSLYNYSTYCADILHLAKHLKIKKCNYLGISMGGIIAMFLAAHFHNVLAIEKLIINDIGPYTPAKPLRALVKVMTELPTFEDQEQAKQYLKAALCHSGTEKEEHWDHLVQHRIMEKGGGYVLTLDPGIGAQLAHDIQQTSDWDIWDVWNKMQCGKILVLKGEHSAYLTSETLRKMLGSKRNISHIEYPGIGHPPSLLVEGRIRDVKQFIRED